MVPRFGSIFMPVTVLGDTAGNELLAQIGVQVRSNVPPQPGDPILVAVSAQKGPMPGLLDALDMAAGYETDRLGIFLTEADRCVDQELAELARSETQCLLVGTRFLPFPLIGDLPVIRSDGDLLQAVTKFLQAEPRKMRLSSPDRND